MFIISWNVAGWSATSAAIRESYGSLQHFFDLTGADIICLQECKGTWARLEADSVTMGASDLPAKKRKPVSPVIPVVPMSACDGSDAAASSAPPCPQTARVVASSSSGGGVPSTGGVSGWESFWAFSGPTHRGFNGVVTFAKRGLTWRCDNAPFGTSEFDSEGRVVVTHHNCFVIVNVYVPNARSGGRLAFKFRFLESLKALLAKLRRETGKAVMLVGDLNMTYRPEDASWALQRIHLRELINLHEEAAQCGEEEKWERQHPHMPRQTLRRLTNAITHVLCRQLCEMAADRQECGGATTTTMESGSLRGQSGDGSLPTTEEEPATTTRNKMVPHSASAVSVDTPVARSDGSFSMQAAEPVLAKIRAAAKGACERPDMVGVGPGGANYSVPPVSLSELYACGFRSVFADELVTSVQPSHNRDVFALTKLCGLPPHGHESVRFMSSLLHEAQWRFDADVQTDDVLSFQATQDKMYDTFRLGEEDGAASERERYCPCPFTCWDQSRNKRLTNEGTRLDYILVDAALAPYVVPRRDTPNNTGFSLVTAADAKATSSNTGSTTPSAASRILVRGPPLSLTSGCAEEVLSDIDDFFSTFSGARRTDSIRRAMADGLYPSAPYDRSGLPPLQDAARGCLLCGLPATGLFVTPPQFSDHIGVGVVFRAGRDGLSLNPRPGKLVEDSGKCMYRPPVGLQSFFTKKTDSSSGDAAPQAPQSPAQRPDSVPPPTKVAKREIPHKTTTVDYIDVDE